MRPVITGSTKYHKPPGRSISGRENAPRGKTEDRAPPVEPIPYLVPE